MAPLTITEDYYMILEVEQTAGHQLIVSSYRRLALKLHPDRNTQPGATAAFQLVSQVSTAKLIWWKIAITEINLSKLGRAYETLGDESKRREYDLIYPEIKRHKPSPRDTRTPCPPRTANSNTEARSEAAQIAAIQQSKRERSARWLAMRHGFHTSILELQEVIQRLEQEIKNLDSIFAAEAATEAQRNSWSSWLLSSVYKRVEDSEAEKARKDRDRQERRIEKDMKERRIQYKKAGLQQEKNRFRGAKEASDAADLRDDEKIQTIRAKQWARETLEREERERLDRERTAELWKEQREAADAVRKQQAQRRAAQQRQREEKTRSQKTNREQQNTPICRHGGWWPKVQGRTSCPVCYQSWNYLLQCPGCGIKACPRCQAMKRPRMSQNAARTSRGVPPRRMSPSVDLDYDCYY